MDILGYFKIDNEHNTTIIDTGLAAPTTGINDFLVKEFDLGLRLLTKSGSSSDGSAYQTINQPSIYKGDTVSTNVACVVDNGFAYSVSGFTGSDTVINGNGIISVNGYARVKPSLLGCLYFSLSPNSSDVSGGIVVDEYQNGTIIRAYSTQFTAYFIITNNTIYFFNSSDFRVGYFDKNSIVFREGIPLTRNRIFLITNAIFTMSGKITDYYKESLSEVEIIVFSRVTNKVIGSGFTDVDGNYLIDVYGTAGEECYAVIFAPPNANFQSRVIDTIILQ